MTTDAGAIDRLAHEVDAAVSGGEWQKVLRLCDQILGIDPENDVGRSARFTASRQLRATKEGCGEKPEPLPASFLNGRYCVTALIGEGKRKKVYLAQDTALDRDVAFVVIKTEGPEAGARVMGHLGAHRRIVAVYDQGVDAEGRPYLVMEHMAGGDLASVLARSPGRRLPIARVAEIGHAVCEGLALAHSRGVVHGDLKCSNVWLSADSEPKIGDFASAAGPDTSKLAGQSAGTASALAPERAAGGQATVRSDLYSLGAVLYEMVSGRPPFLGDDDLAVIGQHINTPPVAPSWHNADCPAALEALILRLLEKNPQARPASAAEVAAALGAIDLGAATGAQRETGGALDSVATGIFVGRRQEMERLRAALERALSGHGGLVMLVGEPGIGKTRAAQELETYACLRNAQVVWGSCHEEQGAPALWPWIQVLRACARESERDRLRAEMGSAGPVIAELASDVRERLPDLPAAQRLDDPDAARFRLFDAVASYLVTASRTQPLVVILDDLHGADRATLQLLEFVARSMSGSRLLLVGTYRDVEVRRTHPLQQSLANLTREQLFERVLLRGLTQDDVRRFIELAAGIEPPEPLVQAVYTNTEGNPLFVSELVRLLVQEGALARSQWTLRIPEGVREVIGRRLDRLSTHAANTLVAAAVLGRQFTLRQLECAVEDTAKERLLDLVDELTAERLIEELSDSVAAYRFTHGLIRQTLLEEVPAARRARSHARIAEALEALYGAEADRHAAELAHHYRDGQAILGGGKLVHYALIAGQQAMEAFAFAEAREWFQAGLAARPDAPMDKDHAALLAGYGRTQVVQSSSRGHDEIYRAFDYYVTSGDVEKALEIASYPVDMSWGIDAAGTSRMTARALELAQPGTLLHAKLLCQHGRCLHQEKGDVEGSRAALEKAGTLARELGDEVLELRARYAVHEAGERRSIDSMEADLERARSLRQPILEQQVIERLFLESLEQGDLRTFDKHLQAAVELDRKVPSYPGNSVYRHGVEYLSLKGRWEEARHLISQVEGSAYHGLLGDILAGGLEHRLGDFEAARKSYERVIERVRPFHSGLASLARAWTRLMAYESGQAEHAELGDRIMRRARDVDVWRHGAAPMLAVSAGLQAVVTADTREAARQYEALSGCDRGVLAYVIAPERVLGLLALTVGDVDRALGHFERTVEVMRKIGAFLELAWACFENAVTLLRKGPANAEKARRLLDEAAQLASRLGLKQLAKRVSEKAAELPAAQPSCYPDELTEREVEVLRMLGRGLTNQEIGDKLFISIKTVATHLRHVYEKANVANRAEATAYAIRNGLAEAGGGQRSQHKG